LTCFATFNNKTNNINNKNMATSIETKAKRNELETKMVLNGEPTNVSIEVIEEDGRFCVQCLVDSNNFDGVEVKPSYPGDMDAFWTFLMRNLHYPESAEADSIEGRVIVQFVVEKDGSLTNFNVLQSPDDRLADEALRVLHQMPRWQPAQQDGRPVRSHYKVPFTFRLK